VIALGIDIDGIKHPLVAGGGLDRERHLGHRADRGPAGTGPGRDTADPGGTRRVQGAAPRGVGCVRPAGAGPLPTPQDQKCSRSIAGQLRSVVATRMRRSYHVDSALAAEADSLRWPPSWTPPTPAPRPACARGMAETLTVLRLGVWALVSRGSHPTRRGRGRVHLRRELPLHRGECDLGSAVAGGQQEERDHNFAKERT
jgi:hypothetical protein